MKVAIARTRHRLIADPRRVLAKPFYPGDDNAPGGAARFGLLLARVLEIPERSIDDLLAAVVARFGSRHADFEDLLLGHFRALEHRLPNASALSPARRLLIGAYFTHEYSVEGAALFNPSIVWAPDQTGDAPDKRRFIMSVRAVGEGHISSIGFRTGTIDQRGEIEIDEPGPHVVGGRRAEPVAYDKQVFRAKLSELGAANALSDVVLSRLPDRFTPSALDEALHWLEDHGPAHAIRYETAKVMRVLAASSYVTAFPPTSALSERVLFPAGPHETHGMEDARFVAFEPGDGTCRYYATYTAYDGFQILPQLIETDDFRTFIVSTLHGAAAQNKGMALFPRPLGGEYLMLSRKDRENLYLARSTDVRSWHDAAELRGPVAPWELLQIGNCGSPIATDAGWLVLTHGVGPMRRYCIGALLLDLDDPLRIIGWLEDPLIEPNADERDGYVPNVVYSCGGIVHAGRLILPYGYSDAAIAIASCDLDELLAALR
jgi:predicted GH43/DUF377 family glycosyl hydrolase